MIFVTIFLFISLLVFVLNFIYNLIALSQRTYNGSKVIALSLFFSLILISFNIISIVIVFTT